MFKKSEAFKNLNEEQRGEIIANILDTKLEMKDDRPYFLKTNSRYGYVLDGDISNFGREDFFEKGEDYAEEIGLDLNDPEIKKKFFIFALNLLKNHDWKTQSARVLRQEQKEMNLRRLEEELKSLQRI